jgi:hypothetical protein
MFTGLAKRCPATSAHDLIARCRAVRTDGWNDYRYVWSTGELLAVAYLLDLRDVLAEMDEDETTVLGRWAYDLWGIDGGEADETDDLRRTRRWFLETRLLAATEAE